MVKYRDNLGGDAHKKIGFIGECYAMLHLAQKGIFCQKLYDVFDFDLLTQQGLRIEVKTSNIIIHKDKRRGDYFRKVWQFNNCDLPSKGRDKGRKRNCDFYIFVCLEKNVLSKIYVVPENKVQARRMITIPCEMKIINKHSMKNYENKWDLITKYSKEVKNK